MPANSTKNIICRKCGKKMTVDKTSFCPSCNEDIYSPEIRKNWNLMILLVIFIVITVLYFVFQLFSHSIYVNLDKV